MVAVTIKTVYARILREIAARPELAREVCLEHSLMARYIEHDDDSAKGFSYCLPKTNYETGTVIYRGKTDRAHWFYFVPTPRLIEIQKDRLLQIARSLENAGGLIKKIKTFAGDGSHVVLDIRSKDEKEEVERKKQARDEKRSTAIKKYKRGVSAPSQHEFKRECPKAKEDAEDEKLAKYSESKKSEEGFGKNDKSDR